LKREIEASIHDGESAKAVQILKCTASEGEGIGHLLEVILKAKAETDSLANRTSPRRLREEAKSLLRRDWESQIESTLKKIKAPQDLKKLFSQK
jgi:putative protein kinase ArgK-like GTPase of G3E family